MLTDYYEQYRAIGNASISAPFYLLQFDKYCSLNAVNEIVITKDLFDEWTAKRDYETKATHHIRTRILRNFSLHLVNNGYDSYATFHKLPSIKSRYQPHIFTDNELTKFFNVADNVKKSAYSPLSHLMLPVVFRILYCCGLRISEVLSLKREDADLENGVLSIYGAKLGKERLVPMSKSLLEVCKKYCIDAQLEQNSSVYFFPAPDKGQFSKVTIYTRFRQILKQAGISHGGRGKGPRLHDFRHTYAVHCLRNWSIEGKDIYVILPMLCRYLGHSNLYSTEYYLRLIPEVFPNVTKSFEKNFGSAFPEVQYEEL